MYFKVKEKLKENTDNIAESTTERQDVYHAYKDINPLQAKLA